VKLRLDKTACVGHALCNSIDPNLFPLDASGYSSVDDQQVSVDDVERAREGVASCPEKALFFDDETDLMSSDGRNDGVDADR